MKNEIILYQSEGLETKLEVQLENETVWLNRQQIAILFDRDIKTVGKHITNIFKEGELKQESTVANFATIQKEGGRLVERNIRYYNLDVIISVGYRVKSKQGTQFRIWANTVIKDYLLRGYVVNKRISLIENSVHNLIKRVDDIGLEIKANLPPNQGIFYDGQVFDAYVFVSKLIKSAKNSILLIDNYIDESVLLLFAKRIKNVKVEVYTANISKILKQDLEKYNSQYPELSISKFKDSHDRFLIIDNKEVYHFGASLKDLGRKWFAFSKMHISSVSILDRLKEVQSA